MKIFFLKAKVCGILLFSCSCITVTGQHEVNFADVEPVCINNKRGFRITAVGALNPGYATTYKWSTGETTQAVTIFEDSFYDGSITCDLHCECGGKAVSKMPVHFPTPNYTITATDASCNNAKDGSVTLTGDGGSQILWNSESTTHVRGLAPGSYTFQVKDHFGCLTEKTAEIKEPETFPPSYKLETIKATCFGKKDGAAFISDSSQQLSLSVKWSNGSTESKADKLPAGMHSIQIRKGAFCNTVDFEVEQPAQITYHYEPITNFNGFPIRCFNSSDGQIDWHIEGGTGPYSASFGGKAYSAKKEAERMHEEGLAAGDYPVAITDRNGCSVNGFISIKGPAKLAIEFNQPNYNSSNIQCNGAKEEMHPIITGGVGQVFYAWSNRGTGNDSIISLSATPALKAGKYRLNIQDGNGCRLDSLLTIQEPEAVDYKPKVIFNSWLIKLALLKITGGSSNKYMVNGKAAQRKIVLSFFTRRNRLEFTLGTRGCPIDTTSFTFDGIRDQLEKGTAKGPVSKTPCPSLP